MADAPANNGANNNNNNNNNNRGGSLGGTLFRMIVLYYLFNTFMKKTPAPMVDPSGSDVQSDVHTGPNVNIFQKGQCLDLQVFLSKDKDFEGFNDPSALIWHEKDICLDWRESNTRNATFIVKLDDDLQHNGTLFAHTFFSVPGYSIDPSVKGFRESKVIYGYKPIITFRPPPKINNLRSLVGGTSTPEEEVSDSSSSGQVAESSADTPEGERPWVAFWNRNLTIHIVDDFSRYSRNTIPPQMSEHMRFDARGNYYPTLYFNDFWVLTEELVPVNDTLSELPIYLSYSPLSLIKWQLYIQMMQSFEMQTSLGSSESELQEFKRMLMDTNPYLLALTFAVSTLHMVFDFLAFKNDVQFWKKNQSMEGLSLRTILLNTFCQLIIFLYLFDNETSWMVVMSCGIGVLIEFWKVTKAVDFEVDRTGPYPKIKWEKKASYTQTDTEEYDAQASKYLYYVLVPLVIGYFIYSLIYEQHKSWYSFVLGSLVGTVYTFGFIMMTPQLFINYKKKSVAHMPWKTFVYKALNTFIDDLFAFIIKMPTLHRLSCFRDDIIFLIFLYQRYIYPIDPNRKNEFGLSKKDLEEFEAEQAAKKAGSNKAAIESSAQASEQVSEQTSEQASEPVSEQTTEQVTEEPAGHVSEESLPKMTKPSPKARRRKLASTG